MNNKHYVIYELGILTLSFLVNIPPTWLLIINYP